MEAKLVAIENAMGQIL